MAKKNSNTLSDVEYRINQIESLCQEVSHFMETKAESSYSKSFEKQLTIYSGRLKNLYGWLVKILNSTANEMFSNKLMDCDEKIVDAMTDVEYELLNQKRIYTKAEIEERIQKLPKAVKHESTQQTTFGWTGYHSERHSIHEVTPLATKEELLALIGVEKGGELKD